MYLSPHGLGPLSLCLLNARSVRNRSAVLLDYLCDCKADLYAMTETRLTEDDAAVRAELNLDGYNFLDHPRRVGVVAERVSSSVTPGVLRSRSG